MTMMDVDLDIWLLVERAARHAADSEVVTRRPDGTVHRTTYGQVWARAQQLMHALDALGLEPGARVGTLAWNGWRHLEAYLAIPGSGRVIHTLNLRLAPDDLAYVINAAEDEAILVDPDLLPLLDQIADRIPTVKHIVVLDEVAPTSALSSVIAYEDLIGNEPTAFRRPQIDERSPLGICFTSGTTGRPKGVVYTHRSTFLHALAVTSHAGFSVGPGDCVLSVVPMFHATAWGLPYAAMAVGAKQVHLAGPLDPHAMLRTLADESVTIGAGVPTVWLSMLEAVPEQGCVLPHLRHIVCGGSQPPQVLIERYQRELGVPIVQAWGMTETSPLAAVAWPQERMREMDDSQILEQVRTRAGLPLPGVDIRLRDAEGNEVPFDGESMGNLEVRGPWVAGSYLNGDGSDSFTDDGWFLTGDVAIGSPEGYFTIADRTKDLIKSGGEWISSVDMEAALMSHPAIVEAAVIASPDSKWQERPLPCIVVRAGDTIEIDEIRDWLGRHGFAAWQLPARFELVESIPRTSVGKFDKKALRTAFGQ